MTNVHHNVHHRLLLLLVLAAAVLEGCSTEFRLGGEVLVPRNEDLIRCSASLVDIDEGMFCRATAHARAPTWHVSH